MFKVLLALFASFAGLHAEGSKKVKDTMDPISKPEKKWHMAQTAFKEMFGIWGNLAV